MKKQPMILLWCVTLLSSCTSYLIQTQQDKIKSVERKQASINYSATEDFRNSNYRVLGVQQFSRMNPLLHSSKIIVNDKYIDRQQVHVVETMKLHIDSDQLNDTMYMIVDGYNYPIVVDEVNYRWGNPTYNNSIDDRDSSFQQNTVSVERHKIANLQFSMTDQAVKNIKVGSEVSFVYYAGLAYIEHSLSKFEVKLLFEVLK